jgi:hypothetical protein
MQMEGKEQTITQVSTRGRRLYRRGQYLAAEEEDPGQAGGGDAAPYDHRRREQRPVAVDHLRCLSSIPLLSRPGDDVR